jgi:hypothetical protein
MKTSRKLIAAAALCVAGIAPALAQGTTFTNGDFSNGLNSWTSIGDVSIGTYQGSNNRAVLTTAYLDGDSITGDQANNISGVSAAPLQNNGYGLNEPGLAPFLSADPAAFDIGGYAFEGSAIKQSFNVLAGDQLSVNFWFGLVTAETDLANFNDFAFITVDGALHKVASITDASRVGSFTYSFTSSGLVTLGFGVVDINDVVGVSEFRVDNISVTAVPEPSSYAMMLAGLALMGSIARRRKV